VPTDAGSPLNRRGRTMFRRPGRLSGAAFVVGLLVALGLARPHVHGPDGTPVESCAVCHLAHERPLPSSPVAALPARVDVALVETAWARPPSPDGVPRPLPHSRAPPA